MVDKFLINKAITRSNQISWRDIFDKDRQETIDEACLYAKKFSQEKIKQPGHEDKLIIANLIDILDWLEDSQMFAVLERPLHHLQTSELLNLKNDLD